MALVRFLLIEFLIARFWLVLVWFAWVPWVAWVAWVSVSGLVVLVVVHPPYLVPLLHARLPEH